MDNYIRHGYHCYSSKLDQIEQSCISHNVSVSRFIPTVPTQKKLSSSDISGATIEQRCVSSENITQPLDDAKLVLDRLQQLKTKLKDVKSTSTNRHEIDLLIKEIELCDSDYQTHRYKALHLQDNLKRLDLPLNTEYKSFVNKSDEGICHGLACSYIQSVLTNTQDEFAEALQLLSRSPEDGWLYRGQVYYNLDNVINLACKDYSDYAEQADQTIPKGKSKFFDMFAKDHPDSFAYMQILARLDSLFLYQMYQYKNPPFILTREMRGQAVNFLLLKPWGLKDTPDDQPPFNTSQKHVAVVTSESLMKILTELPQGAYLLETSEHAMSIEITDESITYFDQNTPLYFIQAKRDNPQTLKVLCDEILLVCQLTADGQIAPISIQQIHLHSEDNQDQAIKQCLENNRYPKINQLRVKTIDKALQLAITHNDADAVYFFLQSKQLILNDDTTTCFLRLAAESNADKEIFIKLVEAGANLYKPKSSKDGKFLYEELIDTIIENDNTSCFEYILSQCPSHDFNNAHLERALTNNSIDIAKKLINLGLPLLYRKPDLDQLITIAINVGETFEIIDLLLTSDRFNINHISRDIISKALIEKNGLTNRTFTYLLKHIPKTDQSFLNSSITHAIRHEKMNIIDLLLKKGAKITYDDIKIAIESQNLSLIKILLKQVSKEQNLSSIPDSLVEILAKQPNLEIANLLIDHGMSLHSKYGLTTLKNLFFANKKENNDIAKLILSKSRLASKVDSNKDSILHYAIMGENISITSFILEHYPNNEEFLSLYATNLEGLNPLDIAIKYNYNNQLDEIIETLKQCGLKTTEPFFKPIKLTSKKQKKGKSFF